MMTPFQQYPLVAWVEKVFLDDVTKGLPLDDLKSFRLAGHYTIPVSYGLVMSGQTVVTPAKTASFDVYVLTDTTVTPAKSLQISPLRAGKSADDRDGYVCKINLCMPATDVEYSDPIYDTFLGGLVMQGMAELIEQGWAAGTNQIVELASLTAAEKALVIA